MKKRFLKRRLYVEKNRSLLIHDIGLIRRRLEAIEEVLSEEMRAEDKAALSEALKEHREGESVPFNPRGSRIRKR